jgi:hypothetical protein
LKKWFRSSSIYKGIWGHLPFTNTFEVVFHLQNNWGRLPFIKQLRSSSIEQKLRSSFIYKTNWGRLPFINNLCRLLLTTFFKLSSICQNIEVVFHLPKCEVVFHLETNCCRLPYWVSLTRILFGLKSQQLVGVNQASISVFPNLIGQQECRGLVLEVVFHLPKILRSSSICQGREVVFHLETNCRRLPYRVSLTRILFLA